MWRRPDNRLNSGDAIQITIARQTRNRGDAYHLIPDARVEILPNIL